MLSFEEIVAWMICISKTHNNTNYPSVINFTHWQEFAFHLQFYSNYGYLKLPV